MGTEHSGVGSASACAVLLTCHGTVEHGDDIAAFVRNIRRGRDAPDEVVAEVRARFEQIGGSPLMRVTHAQAAALEARLGLTVRAAGRLWHPYPAEVLAQLRDEGVDTVVSLPLAPQSTHVYNAAVEQAAAPLDMRVIAAPSWGLSPALIAAFVEAIAEAQARVAPGAAIVLSAHSLPLSIIAAGDPYERDFRAMASAVARELDGVVEVAFQSQGIGGGAWLGPDLEAIFRKLRPTHDELVIAPIGFLAEHVETLYDIDIAANELATSLGFTRIARMPAMNTRAAFIDALEAVARSLLPAR
jgi:ferrochelatase